MSLGVPAMNIRGMNKSYLSGTVIGPTALLTELAGGRAKLTLGLHTENARKIGNEWRSEPDEHFLTAEGVLARSLADTVRGGDTLWVECMLRPRTWLDGDVRHRTVDVVVLRVIAHHPKGRALCPFTGTACTCDAPKGPGGVLDSTASCPNTRTL